jgi:hypothetical protein
MNELKNRIVKAIELVTKEMNYELIKKDWGNEDAKCACALGCVLVATDQGISPDAENNGYTVGEVLNVTEDWVDSFIAGFDGVESTMPPVVSSAFQLGQEIATQFNPKETRKWF